MHWCAVSSAFPIIPYESRICAMLTRLSVRYDEGEAARGKGRRGGGSAVSAARRLKPAGIPVWFFEIELVFGLQDQRE